MRRLGLAAFVVLWIGFGLDFWIGGRDDQYCFGPPVNNWAWHTGQFAFALMLLSVVAAIVALIRSDRKPFAAATLFLFLPLLLLDALRMGCN